MKPETEAGSPVKCSEHTVSRRDFVNGAAAFALATMAPSLPAFAQLSCSKPPAPGIPFTADTGLAIRTRKDVDQVLLNPFEINRLKTAFAAYKLLTTTAPNDPRGWVRQSLIHCAYCSGPASIDIHGNWFFFPWHRAYLYFVERIMGKLINDMSFTLPYWSWPNTPHLPDAYHDFTLSLNPLHDGAREVTNTKTFSMNPPDRGFGAEIAGAMTTRQTDLFLGRSPDMVGNDRRRGGPVEQGPHNWIHNFVGGLDAAGKGKPDMSLFRTAALDPVFFAHHSNVDRMWAMWISQPGRFNHSAAAWLDEAWTFYDENQQVVRITVRQVLDHENNLRYRYDNITVPPNVVPTVGSTAGGTTTVLDIPIDVPIGASRALLPSPISFQINLSLDQRGTLLAARPEIGRAVNLEISGIEVPHDTAAMVKIFLNQPTAVASTSTADAGYLTTLSFTAYTDEPIGFVHGKRGAAWDITDRIPLLLANPGPLTITLVPTTLDETTPTAINLTYQALSLTVVEIAP
jgi:polyphenol oxidase